VDIRPSARAACGKLDLDDLCHGTAIRTICCPSSRFEIFGSPRYPWRAVYADEVSRLAHRASSDYRRRDRASMGEEIAEAAKLSLMKPLQGTV